MRCVVAWLSKQCQGPKHSGNHSGQGPTPLKQLKASIITNSISSPLSNNPIATMSLFKSNKNKTSSAASTPVQTPAQTPRPSIQTARTTNQSNLLTFDQVIDLTMKKSSYNTVTGPSLL
ncbi:hypothetical protein BC939DRAFT_506944 [Gamsiella multidivaricata]|uniref:uncharacterized protein n=1 Tax=Gamsiella multidivaricata TaxID=101098 RepID=UPI002220BBB8|nr:uncharacterized protein BC939DRAFT_506944 [Gamsiella multidivaricata]KAI7817983.1 hypothetical protein BC939DRAFT_506944 [Gamsiella multidivaricata]